MNQTTAGKVTGAGVLGMLLEYWVEYMWPDFGPSLPDGLITAAFMTVVAWVVPASARLSDLAGVLVLCLLTGIAGCTLSISPEADLYEARLLSMAEGDTVQTRTVTNIGVNLNTVDQASLPSINVGYQTYTESSVPAMEPPVRIPEVSIRRGVDANGNPDSSIIESVEVGQPVEPDE